MQTPRSRQEEHIALEFLLRYRSDEEDGNPRTLGDYLALYPGHEELIASEFLELKEEAVGASGLSAGHSVASTRGMPSGGTAGGPEPAGVPSGATRYTRQQRVGAGGMGEVYRGRDIVLDREVAIKYPRESGHSGHRTSLLREAATAARLDHPNIPPVHDLAVDATGRPFLVMRLVRGRPLSEVLDGRDSDATTLPRLLTLFQQICGAIDYAHDRGILHLDLKPANVMVGEFGEMQIIDWGLSSSHTTDDPSTGVRGTPGYMAPEQRAGEKLTQATDVYALGLILFEICTGKPAFPRRRGSLQADSIHKGTRWSAVAAPLQDIIEKATDATPSGRYVTPTELSDDIQLFLEGVRDEERRLRAAEEATEAAREESASRSEALARATELDRELERHPIESWQSAREKSHVWSLEDARDGELEAAERALEEVTSYLHSAYRQAPQDLAIRDRWAEHCWERFLSAEESADRFQQGYFERELRSLALPHYDELLQGEGTLMVECEPRPERVILHRLVERERRLRPTQRRDLLAKPLPNGSIPFGRWQLTIERSGYAPLVAPLYVRRGERIRLKWQLRRPSEIADGFQWIPSGACTLGGDPQTLQSLPQTRVHVRDFCIARFPVTVEEYLEFVRDTCAGSPRHAARRVPRVSANGEPHAFVNMDTLRLKPRDDGSTEQRRWPVLGISWRDATAYARWKSDRDGRRYRLPSDVEWEKAARGTDQRIFPWGDRYDASFCKNLGSTEGRTNPEPIGRYKADVSPYGVRDMAGGVREWCRSWFSKENNQRLVRGGGWNQTPIGSRCAYRLPCPPDLVYPFIGFRLTHSF